MRAGLRGATALWPAGVVALALFWVMQWLVSGGVEPPPVESTQVQLERVRVVSDPPPPPRPTVEPNAPTRPQRVASSAPAQRVAAPAPPAEIDIEVPALATGGILFGSGELSGSGAGFSIGSRQELAAFDSDDGLTLEGRDTIPIASVRPRYPRYAAERQIEGWVELLYTIGADGRVSDIRIVDASPRGIFEEAAAAAIARWLYSPLYRSGRPLTRQATQRFEFTRADINPLNLSDD